MNTGIKAVLLVLSVAGLGAAGYLLTRKSNTALRHEIVGYSSNESDRQLITTVVNKMNRQELLDTYRALQIPENSKATIDPAFKARVIAISNKYNIFT